MDHLAFAQLLGSYGEFVGAIAVVATLGYLAVQLRQNTQSLRISAELAVSQQLSDFAARMRAQPDMLKLWDAAAIDAASLSPEERGQYRWVIAELFLMYEGQYHLLKRGHISVGAWEAKAAMVVGLLENPIVAEWWSLRMCPISEEFRDYIDSLSPSVEWEYQSISGIQ